MIASMHRNVGHRFFTVKRFFDRVTPLTWVIWAALLSDLCAPGYLVFHIGIRTVDASVIATEVLALWKFVTDAPDD